jgi:hypothetical protein
MYARATAITYQRVLDILLERSDQSLTLLQSTSQRMVSCFRDWFSTPALAGRRIHTVAAAATAATTATPTDASGAVNIVSTPG